MKTATAGYRAVLYDAAIISLLGAGGSVIVGILQAGTTIFDVHSPFFRYIEYGSATALLFAIYRKRGLPEALYFSAVLALVFSIFVRDNFVEELGHLTFFLTLVCFAYYAIWKLFGTWVPFGKFVAVSLSFWSIEFLTSTFLSWLLDSMFSFEMFETSTFLVGSVGLGVGIGVEFAELLLRGVRSHTGRSHLLHH